MGQVNFSAKIPYYTRLCVGYRQLERNAEVYLA